MPCTLQFLHALKDRSALEHRAVDMERASAVSVPDTHLKSQLMSVEVHNSPTEVHNSSSSCLFRMAGVLGALMLRVGALVRPESKFFRPLLAQSLSFKNRYSI